MPNNKRGFTLIEILAVVAIIAILFVILLAQLGVAKRRAASVALKEGLSSFRLEAQLQARSDSDGYTNVCDIGTKAGDYLLKAVQRARPSIDNLDDSNGITCRTLANSYAVDVNGVLADLDLEDTFCVDSSGHAEEGSVDASNNQYISCTAA